MSPPRFMSVLLLVLVEFSCDTISGRHKFGEHQLTEKEGEVRTKRADWEVVDHSGSKMHETCLIIIHDPWERTEERQCRVCTPSF